MSSRDPHRLVRVGLGVPGQELDLPAEHAALGVDLVDVHLGALGGGLAEERGRPGERHGHADLDRFLGFGRHGQGQQRG
jgi:hypothetical protein